MRSKRLSRRKTSGFALVITVSLLVLLTLLALGMLSVSTIALRAAGQNEALSIARTNARLAMMLAIGDLQKYAGPDQRITATASILDSNPTTEDPDNVAEPNVTGVWNSYYYNPFTSSSNSTTSPNNAYDKKTQFQRWLMSGLTETEASNQSTLAGTIHPAASKKSTNGSAGGVRLVGPGTTNVSDQNSPLHVWAGKTNINPDASFSGTTSKSTKMRGSFAYAVLDEGTKARVNLGTPTGLNASERPASVTGAPMVTAYDRLNDSTKGSLSNYSTYRTTQDKAITMATAPLLGGKDNTKPLGGYFNDLTTDSASVICDVTHGGLRKDLSLFGEMSVNPYANRRLYSDSTSPIANEPSTSANYNPGSPDPYWDLIYDNLRFTNNRV